MIFSMDHININVTNVEKSLEFYKRVLNMREIRRKEASDGSYILVFMKDQSDRFMIELTWLRDKDGKYELGDNETHIAFVADDYDKAYKFHKEMGIICYENAKMGIYFIEDPDGYWFEIAPRRG